MGETETIPFSSENTMEPVRVVGLFSTIFRSILLSDNLQLHIQSVKKDLYNRDYLQAFESDDKRFAYVARWSPARALAYQSLFALLEPIKSLFSDPSKKVKCLSIGGGAGAEIVALASVFCRLKEYNSTSDSKLELTAIDIADWSLIVTKLTEYIKENWIYDASKLNTEFVHGDVLEYQLPYQEYDLITLMFTTNELFAEKKAQTIRMLQKLNKSCKKGALLLIAESAGSYSHITVGTKQFPVQFLVDTILTGKPNEIGSWSIVDQTDSCWYRIDPTKVNYSMKLENMRFFYRLYRKN